jgi:hypothetical protein
MAAGSAFDAFVKSYLHQELFGAGHPRAAEYELRTIFEAQVEAHNRDWAWEAGQYLFGHFKDSGALADLMLEMSGSAIEPRFEIAIQGAIGGKRAGLTRDLAVPLLGKPDIFFMTAQGAHVIHDMKVRGFCSKYNTSPTPGYQLVRDCHNTGAKGHLTPHKNYVPLQFQGMEIDSGFLEDRNAQWATQLATYGWLLGEPVGHEFITAIEEIVCSPTGGMPKLRIAHHRTRVSHNHQMLAIAAYQELWARITEQPTWFFRELRPEEDAARRELLEKEARLLYNPERPLTENEQWLANVTRKQSRY